ncbi:MAG: hypothetical protein KKA05_03555, partial [Alphaproteobacteria bacterium]|nr:hypothetical protein [Alphaproteobacteria bacterium]
GILKRETVDVGSKSERTAVTLHGAGAKPLVLQLVGASSFGDDSFGHLVGKKVTVQGTVTGSTLYVQSMNDITVSNQGLRPPAP